MCHHRSASCGIFFSAAVMLLISVPLGAEEAPVTILYPTPRTSAQACGIDALYVCMLASGARGISLSSLDRQIPLQASGASLEDLAKACEKHKVMENAVRAHMTDLMSWENPAVLHVRGNHYVAFLGIHDNRLLLFDNSVGLFECSPDYFTNVYNWDGVALIVGPPGPKLVMQLYGPGLAFLAGGILLFGLGVARFRATKMRS